MPLIDFLREFAALTSVQQRVYLFCLTHLPHPRLYSSDIRRIAVALDLSPRTVQRALQSIKHTKTLRRAVCAVRINQKEHLTYDCTDQDQAQPYL